jgi:hypothetical protein
MSVKINDLTVGQHITGLNKRVQWLKRLNRLLVPHLSKLSGQFALAPSNLTPPAAGEKPVAVLTYVGDATDDAGFAAHVRRLENTLDVRFNDGTADLTAGRVSLTVRIVSKFESPEPEPTEPPTGDVLQVVPARRKRTPVAA